MINKNIFMFVNIVNLKNIKKSQKIDFKPLNLLGKRGYTCDQNQNLNIVIKWYMN